MSTDHRAAQNPTGSPPSGAAMGLILFAGIMMIMVGVFQAIQGIVALVNDTFYVVGQKWVFSFNITTWGWIHLLGYGDYLNFAGIALFASMTIVCYLRMLPVLLAHRDRLAARDGPQHVPDPGLTFGQAHRRRDIGDNCVKIHQWLL